MMSIYKLGKLFKCTMSRLIAYSVHFERSEWHEKTVVKFLVIIKVNSEFVMVSRLFLPAPELSTQVKEVPVGATAILQCSSKDDNHNFLFWQLGQNKIIGPGNVYDSSKYKYEVLSGRLFIKKVTAEESGYYRCISKSLSSDNMNVGAVEMIVKDNYTQPADESSDLETIKIIFIVLSLVVLIICAIFFYRMRKDDKKRTTRLVMLEDDDDEGSGDEIYNRTTTVINDSVPGPSKRPSEHITGIDNEGLDTDFNAAFEQISIKAANRNLV